MNHAEVTEYIRSVLRAIEEVILQKSPWFNFSKSSTDGRTNSQQSEHMVTDYLLNHPSLTDLLVKKSAKAKAEGEDNRAFGDIGIDLSFMGIREPFPCNIKLISEDNASGNNSCGLTTLISYTYGIKCASHPAVAKALCKLDKEGYEGVHPRLYGLIMIKKESPSCWAGTFDEVPAEQISTNPSNPLQVTFPKRRIERTEEEYMRLLFEKVREYNYKKSEAALIFRSYSKDEQEPLPPVCDRS
jgi:hypothetical protein